MKFVLVTDTHLGLNKASDFYHGVTLDLFQRIISFCTIQGINQVVHLGDFFHDRKELNTKTQRVAHRIGHLFESNKIIMFLITGNHDVYFKDTLETSTLELFSKYEYITVIDKPTDYGEVVFCPWSMIPGETKAKYCMGHFSIIGFNDE